MKIIRVEKVTIEFYNRISGNTAESLEDIPQGAMDLISFMDFEFMAKPLAALNKSEKGTPLRQMTVKYSLRKSTIHDYLVTYGING